MSPITVPTAPDPKAPYFLDREYDQGGGLWTVTVTGQTDGIVLKAVNGSPEEARRRAWVACCALNAAHMAGPHALDHANVRALDRPAAAALGFALIQFAATGRLPGEDS